MEERDLSSLNFRELIQMLGAILLPLQNNGDGVEKQMQKSQMNEVQEIEEENKNVEEQLKFGPFSAKEELEEVVNDYLKEEKEIEAEEKEKVLPFPHDEDTKEEKNEAKVNEEKKEEKEPTELKLSPFPCEEKLGVSSENPREKMKIEGSQVLEAAKTVPSIPRDVRQVRRRSLQSASHTNNMKKEDEQKHSVGRQNDDGKENEQNQSIGRQNDDDKEEKERWRLDWARFINYSRSPKLNDFSFLGPNGFLIYKRRTAQPHPTFNLRIMRQLMGLGLKVGEKTLILQRNNIAASRKTPICAAQPFFSLATHVAIENREASPPLVSLLRLSETASNKAATFFPLSRIDALKIVGILFVEVDEQIQFRNTIIATLKENLIKAQEEMRKQANKHRRDIQFDVGNQVYVRIQPYRLRSLAKQVNENLSLRFYGPFTTIEKMELLVQPEAVCKTRKLTNGQAEVLIKWKDMPPYENSWEELETISTQFPDFHLEDKVKLLGEGNARTLPFMGKVYARTPRKT